MALVATVGRVAALRIASGASSALSDEPMSEVNMSADPTETRPRYTVYEITDAAKRNLDDAVTPVFQWSEGGTAAYTTLTTSKVEFPDCRIYLPTALASADVVRCASGNYITPASVSGVLNVSFDADWEREKIMFLRDTAKRTVLKNKQWTATAELAQVSTCATLTTAMAGDDNDITLVHTPGGTAGNAISLTLTDPATDATLSIAVSGNDINVTLGYASAAINTTANALVAALNANGQVRDLGVAAEVKSGDAGTGLVTALTHTHLSGGLNPTDWTTITGTSGNVTAVAEFYSDYDNDIRWVDYCQIPKSSIKIGGDAFNKVTLSMESRGGANCGPYLRHG